MTGPDHYLTAVQFVTAATNAFDRDNLNVATVLASLAQVHATLAAAAATALNDADGGMTASEQRAWREAAGTRDKRGGF